MGVTLAQNAASLNSGRSVESIVGGAAPELEEAEPVEVTDCATDAPEPPLAAAPAGAVPPAVVDPPAPVAAPPPEATGPPADTDLVAAVPGYVPEDVGVDPMPFGVTPAAQGPAPSLSHAGGSGAMVAR